MAVEKSTWLTVSITLALATISVLFWKSKWRDANEKIKKLETSLKAALDNCVAERQGRIRAQQALRKALTQPNSDKLEWHSYPMAPIGTIRSCFSTRNGTPRQPLLVPLARAHLRFDSARVPPASLEGLEGYSHCWIIYVFHLNTDLEKLWKHPSKSKFKSKVRVPALNGRPMGVLATRSPHRPCPIGLTVAKVEGIEGQRLLLSSVDLVDGTPILDVKPYLPYSDSINEATVPDWVKAKLEYVEVKDRPVQKTMELEKHYKSSFSLFSVELDNSLAVASVDFSEGFSASLSDCWLRVKKKSLYSTMDEFKGLISQVLSWDIRSVSQRNRPHQAINNVESGSIVLEDNQLSGNGYEGLSDSSGNVIYHVVLENLDVSYRVDGGGNILVESVTLSAHSLDDNQVSTTASQQETPLL